MNGKTSIGRKILDIFLWRGLLGEAPRSIRVMALALVCLTIVTLSVTQLGMIYIFLPGIDSVYMYIAIAPLVVGSLLFGVLRGTFIGLLAGIVAVVHSEIMPIDYYEALVIKPDMTIVAFVVVGFFAAVLFAIAIKIAKSSRFKRYVGYVITSLVVAAMFTTLMFIGMYGLEYAIHCIGNLFLFDELMNFSLILAEVFYGSVALQTIFDALLVLASCIIVDCIYERYAKTATCHRIETLFRGWLLAVTFGVFMIVAVIAFCSETVNELNQADQKVVSELEYLVAQIEDRDARKAAAEAIILEGGDSGESEARAFDSVFSVENLLSGYDMNLDGVIIIFKDGEVVESNSSVLKRGTYVGELFFANAQESVDEIVEGDGLQEFIVNKNAAGESDNVEGVFLTNTAIVFFNGASVGDYQVIIGMTPELVFANRTSTMLWTAFLTIVLLAAVFVLASILLKRLIVRRIDENNVVLARIASGNLDEHLESHDTYEFASLANGVNSMVDSLKETMDDIASRMERELATAKAIQASALPSALAPLPGIGTIGHFSLMHPAREVGGDFYDFFPVESWHEEGDGLNRVAFLIADVSGKGIPAALFMMTSKTQVQNYIATGMPLTDAIDSANHLLCRGNDAGMFVTLFACVLDCDTGRLVCVNAGHNPPLLFHDGSWEWMREVGGLPLGLFEDMPYTGYEICLEPGDRLFMYTDGVTEAMSVDNELFGEDRLVELVEGLEDAGPRDLIENVLDALSAHAEGAEQSDDITMLSFEYGSEMAHSLQE